MALKAQNSLSQFSDFSIKTSKNQTFGIFLVFRFRTFGFLTFTVQRNAEIQTSAIWKMPKTGPILGQPECQKLDSRFIYFFHNYETVQLSPPKDIKVVIVQNPNQSGFWRSTVLNNISSYFNTSSLEIKVIIDFWSSSELNNKLGYSQLIDVWLAIKRPCFQIRAIILETKNSDIQMPNLQFIS